MKAEDLSNRLSEKGLKVTPQRIAVLEAISGLKSHPVADTIIENIRKNNPNISTATVYKILDAFVSHGLIRRVKTEKDIMRYDPITESHHHIYCTGSETIKDYHDNELNMLLREYFERKKIPGFRIDDLRLHIIGNYIKNKK